MNPQDVTGDEIAGKEFRFDELSKAREAAQRAYLEFLRVPSLSMGLYALAAGGVDPQKPHTEDEVYYVVKGRASIVVGEEDYPVEVGSVVFVKAGVEHRFHDIGEDLEVLVFFAPAEYTRGVGEE